VQVTIQAGLQRWLSDVILVQKVEVTSEDSTLRALVQYVVKRTNQTQTATIVKCLTPKNMSICCQQDDRRDAVRRAKGLNGLDYIEVSNDQLTLTAFFLASFRRS
jgi:hypothetical protein